MCEQSLILEAKLLPDRCENADGLQRRIWILWE